MLIVLISGCSPSELTENNSSFVAATISEPLEKQQPGINKIQYVQGFANQQVARERITQLLQETLQALPSGSYFSHNHPSYPGPPLSGDTMIACDDYDLAEKTVRYSTAYYLVVDPPKNSFRYAPTITKYWHDHGWKVTEQHHDRIVGNPPAPLTDYSVALTKSVEGDVSVSTGSNCFPHEHNDGTSLPNKITQG